jgi:hypothetical protein
MPQPHQPGRRDASAFAMSTPVLIGALVMAACDAPTSRWAVHLIVGALGLLTYRALRATTWPATPSTPWITAAVAVAWVASTLLGEGIQGVTRWSGIGPLRLHPSALLTPSLLVFATQNLTAHPRAAHLLLFALQGVHALQPDAGQATALGVACAVATLSRHRPTLGGGALATAHLGVAALAWLRPDPLDPAPFVEDILSRAFAYTPALGALALSALLLGVASPLLALESADSPRARRLVPITFSAYLGAAALVTVLGEFPTPLLGFSPSIILGAFAALGLLRRPSA